MIRISSIEKLIGAFIAFISCMLIVRMLYSESNMYLFLLWNIFLACIPFEISVLLVKQKRNKWAEAILFSAWLLFFPNALYILTDLVHLEVKTTVPLWFDAILLFASASTGLIMAFASLYKIESFLKTKVRDMISNGIILACLFLGSFGVYLGRFQRWNSWDIINDPFSLTISMAKLFLFPLHYTHAWAFTFIFAGFIYLLFCSLKYFTVKNKIS
jgi:uncharacterized membrane protein